MATRSGATLVLILLGYVSASVTSHQHTQTLFEKRYGLRSLAGILRTISVAVDADCSAICVSERECNAFNVGSAVDGTSARICKLLTIDSNSIIVPQLDWTLFVGKHPLQYSIQTTFSPMFCSVVVTSVCINMPDACKYKSCADTVS